MHCGLFGLFRKSNLVLKSPSAFHCRKHLLVKDVSKCPAGLALKVKWTKTIQCRERYFHIPLPFLQGHPLYPVTVVISLLMLHPNLDPNAPLFSLGSVSSVLTQSSFVRQLHNHLLRLGLPANQFSGHSFRRGGAVWAFKNGLTGEIVQTLGDWKSHGYLAYLDISLVTKFTWLQQFSTFLPYT